MDDLILGYRATLLELRREAQNNYDRYLLSLSGGALGLSIAFIKDIVRTNPALGVTFALVAWGLWTLSLLAVLASFFTSKQALDLAIRQVDNEPRSDSRLGGKFDKATAVLNLIAGLSFLVGTGFFVYFVSLNLRGQ
jgi:hypothetical protein